MTTILIVSPEAWNSHTVSKHHYAMTLAAQGHLVLFLDPPKDAFQLIKVHPNLFVVQSPPVRHGLRFYPGFLRRRLERAWLHRLELACGAAIDVLWLFENSRFFDMQCAGHRLKIYHQVDLNQNLHPASAARTADICFCTSDGIRDSLLPFNPLIYKIHHGTALPDQPLDLTAGQAESMLHAGPSACYIGNLDMPYLDAELLAKVAQAYPEARFHFVGGYSPLGRLYQLASKLTNVVWWGKVPSTTIPSILQHADVMLVAYQAEHYSDQSSPHKFMEYLASGKTIVATYTDEYKDKRHLIEMVDDAADFVPALGRVFANMPEFNSHAKQVQRKAFAAEHSYPRQLKKIIALLSVNGLSGKLIKTTSK